MMMMMMILSGSSHLGVAGVPLTVSWGSLFHWTLVDLV